MKARTAQPHGRPGSRGVGAALPGARSVHARAGLTQTACLSVHVKGY